MRCSVALATQNAATREKSHPLAIDCAHAIRSQRVCGQNPCVEGRRASLHQKTPPIYIHALVSIAAMQKSYSLGISLTRNDRLACDESLTTSRLLARVVESLLRSITSG